MVIITEDPRVYEFRVRFGRGFPCSARCTFRDLPFTIALILDLVVALQESILSLSEELLVPTIILLSLYLSWLLLRGLLLLGFLLLVGQSDELPSCLFGSFSPCRRLGIDKCTFDARRVARFDLILGATSEAEGFRAQF